MPYLIDFVKLLHPAELPSSTGDILNSYLQYINLRGGKMNLLSQAQVGFRRAFKKLAIRNKIRECTNPRGYYMQVPRISRSIIDEKCKELLTEHTQVFDKLFVNKKIGYGMFAKCDIPIKYNLIGYKGQWITSSENKNREKNYAKNGIPPVFVVDPITKLVLDGNRNKDGVLFKNSENLARYFNHSKKFPNCKLIVQDDNSRIKRLYLVTVENIPKGSEIVWNYGENNKITMKFNSWLAM